MSDKIQAVNFLSTLYGDCLIVLIYQNKVFDDEWDIKASAVRNGIVNELFPDGLPGIQTILLSDHLSRKCFGDYWSIQETSEKNRL